MDDTTAAIDMLTKAFCIGQSEAAKEYCRGQLTSLVQLAKAEKEIELLSKRIKEIA